MFDRVDKILGKIMKSKEWRTEKKDRRKSQIRLEKSLNSLNPSKCEVVFEFRNRILILMVFALNKLKCRDNKVRKK